MSEPTNQPSHRPLREGEVIEDNDEAERAPNIWEQVTPGSVGNKYRPGYHVPMRRPVKD